MNSFSEDSSSDGNPGAQVLLNVYDLTPLNSYIYWFGLGIFHSGIEVHGVEYGFGAHDFSTSGVFAVDPKSCSGFSYRCSILLGHTNLAHDELRTFLQTVAAEYHGDTYHLISKNCNHFTDDISLRLTGRRIPGWVNRLARLGAMCNCLLPESFQVTAVKQLPEYHNCSEDDGSECLSAASTHDDPTENDDADEDKHLLLSRPSGGGTDVTFIKENER